MAKSPLGDSSCQLEEYNIVHVLSHVIAAKRKQKGVCPESRKHKAVRLIPCSRFMRLRLVNTVVLSRMSSKRSPPMGCHGAGLGMLEGLAIAVCSGRARRKGPRDGWRMQ